MVADQQLFLPALLPALDRLAKGHAVERAARPGQIVKIGFRHGRDGEAAMIGLADQVFARQPAQGLADRAQSHREALA
jgi:hypothetical protein